MTTPAADRPTGCPGSVESVEATGMIDGRPVSRILVELAPGESVTLTYTMSDAKGKYGRLEMRDPDGVA